HADAIRLRHRRERGGWAGGGSGCPRVPPVRVTLLVTCVVDVFEPDVGSATVRVLRAAGCDVSCDLDQTCCGQPAWNAGFAPQAARVAATTLDALERELDSGAEAV